VTLSTEALLALLIVVLYLKDSVFLLNVNEALLISRKGVRWSASFGARTWKIAGKEPFIANPLLPDQAVFRLRWNMDSTSGRAGSVAGVPVEIPAELVSIGHLVWFTWIALFALLPASLIGRLGPSATITAIVLVYVSIVASLVRLWLWRRPLGIKPRDFSVLAFECVACPPYAANLVRRLTAMRGVDENFEAAAHRLLGAAQLSEVRTKCLARIDEQLERIGEDERDFDTLKQARRRFLESEDVSHVIEPLRDAS
jgi:hypothetical protein